MSLTWSKVYRNLRLEQDKTVEEAAVITPSKRVARHSLKRQTQKQEVIKDLFARTKDEIYLGRSYFKGNVIKTGPRSYYEDLTPKYASSLLFVCLKENASIPLDRRLVQAQENPKFGNSNPNDEVLTSRIINLHLENDATAHFACGNKDCPNHVYFPIHWLEHYADVWNGLEKFIKRTLREQSASVEKFVQTIKHKARWKLLEDNPNLRHLVIPKPPAPQIKIDYQDNAHVLLPLQNELELKITQIEDLYLKQEQIVNKHDATFWLDRLISLEPSKDFSQVPALATLKESYKSLVVQDAHGSWRTSGKEGRLNNLFYEQVSVHDKDPDLAKQFFISGNKYNLYQKEVFENRNSIYYNASSVRHPAKLVISLPKIAYRTTPHRHRALFQEEELLKSDPALEYSLKTAASLSYNLYALALGKDHHKVQHAAFYNLYKQKDLRNYLLGMLNSPISTSTFGPDHGLTFKRMTFWFNPILPLFFGALPIFKDDKTSQAVFKEALELAKILKNNKRNGLHGLTFHKIRRCFVKVWRLGIANLLRLLNYMRRHNGTPDAHIKAVVDFYDKIFEELNQKEEGVFGSKYKIPRTILKGSRQYELLLQAEAQIDSAIADKKLYINPYDDRTGNYIKDRYKQLKEEALRDIKDKLPEAQAVYKAAKALLKILVSSQEQKKQSLSLKQVFSRRGLFAAGVGYNEYTDLRDVWKQEPNDFLNCIFCPDQDISKKLEDNLKKEQATEKRLKKEDFSFGHRRNLLSDHYNIALDNEHFNRDLAFGDEEPEWEDIGYGEENEEEHDVKNPMGLRDIGLLHEEEEEYDYEEESSYVAQTPAEERAEQDIAEQGWRRLQEFQDEDLNPERTKFFLKVSQDYNIDIHQYPTGLFSQRQQSLIIKCYDLDFGCCDLDLLDRLTNIIWEKIKEAEAVSANLKYARPQYKNPSKLARFKKEEAEQVAETKRLIKLQKEYNFRGVSRDNEALAVIKLMAVMGLTRQEINEMSASRKYGAGKEADKLLKGVASTLPNEVKTWLAPSIHDVRKPKKVRVQAGHHSVNFTQALPYFWVEESKLKYLFHTLITVYRFAPGYILRQDDAWWLKILPLIKEAYAILNPMLNERSLEGISNNQKNVGSIEQFILTPFVSKSKKQRAFAKLNLERFRYNFSSLLQEYLILKKKPNSLEIVALKDLEKLKRRQTRALAKFQRIQTRISKIQNKAQRLKNDIASFQINSVKHTLADLNQAPSPATQTKLALKQPVTCEGCKAQYTLRKGKLQEKTTYKETKIKANQTTYDRLYKAMIALKLDTPAPFARSSKITLAARTKLQDARWAQNPTNEPAVRAQALQIRYDQTFRLVREQFRLELKALKNSIGRPLNPLEIEDLSQTFWVHADVERLTLLLEGWVGLKDQTLNIKDALLQRGDFYKKPAIYKDDSLRKYCFKFYGALFGKRKTLPLNALTQKLYYNTLKLMAKHAFARYCGQAIRRARIEAQWSYHWKNSTSKKSIEYHNSKYRNKRDFFRMANRLQWGGFLRQQKIIPRKCQRLFLDLSCLIL